MSKLSEHVRRTITRERGVLDMPFNINMSYNEHTVPDYDYSGRATKVEFKAEFGAEYFISGEMISDPVYINYVHSKVREGVIEEVFGEFRKPIREIEHLLYSHKYDAAMKALHSLRKQMYE